MRKDREHFFFLLIVFLFLSGVYIADALTLTDSEDVSVSARVGTLPIIDEGGGGGAAISQSGVRFSGYAYPLAKITVLQGASEVGSFSADEQGSFSLVLSGSGSNFFTLFATDVLGHKSTLLNFPTIFYTGYLTDITGIRFAPTITSDKLSVKQGEYVTIEGYALPGSALEIIFDGQEELSTFKPAINQTGKYTITIPLKLTQGDYTVKAKYHGDSRTSKAMRIVIGASTMLRTDVTNNIPGDCNSDLRINLADFSMFAYWYGKLNPPSCIDTNSDKKVDLVDFSILAFYWNG